MQKIIRSYRYITVNSKDSVSTTIDLLKGYDMTKPAKYNITYVGQGMSGLIVKDSISFVYANKVLIYAMHLFKYVIDYTR